MYALRMSDVNKEATYLLTYLLTYNSLLMFEIRNIDQYHSLRQLLKSHRIKQIIRELLTWPWGLGLHVGLNVILKQLILSFFYPNSWRCKCMAVLFGPICRQGISQTRRVRKFLQWHPVVQNKFESGGGAPVRSESAPPLFGSKSTISRFGERFVMVSTD